MGGEEMEWGWERCHMDEKVEFGTPGKGTTGKKESTPGKRGKRWSNGKGQTMDSVVVVRWK